MFVLVFLLLETSSPKISSISMKELFGMAFAFSAYSPKGSVIWISCVKDYKRWLFDLGRMRCWISRASSMDWSYLKPSEWLMYSLNFYEPVLFLRPRGTSSASGLTLSLWREDYKFLIDDCRVLFLDFKLSISSIYLTSLSRISLILLSLMDLVCYN